MPTTEVLYTDLDGTLLGPGGSLFTVPGDGWTSRAVDALLRLHEAGVAIVLVSGRTQGQIAELARAVSASAYIAEMGALVVDRSEFPERTHRAFGAFRGAGTPFEAMVRSGAGGLLIERYGGRLEPHAPWSQNPREATMLFRGHVPLDEAQAVLRDAGHHWLELKDNGLILRPFPHLEVDEVHAYHLVPRGVSKSAGVRMHMELAGFARGGAAGVGDSASDLELAEVVGRMFITSNGRATIGDDLPANAGFTDASHGEGFAEAVDAVLR